MSITNQRCGDLIGQPSGGWGPNGGWNTAKDFDFTSLGAQTFNANGAYTIGGSTFTKINTANEVAPAEMIVGTGIVFQPTQVTNIYQADRSLPALTLNLLSIIPNMGPDTMVRVWLWNSANNASQASQAAALAIEDPAHKTNYIIKRGYTAGSTMMYINATVNGISQGDAIDNSLYPDDVMGLWVPLGVTGGFCFHECGVYSAGWPVSSGMTVFGSTKYGIGGIQQLNTNFSPANLWDVLIGAHRAGAAGAFSATLARLRVEYQ